MLNSLPTDLQLKADQAWCNVQSSALRFKAALDFNRAFDFQSIMEEGKILFVGEGNLSFSRALIIDE